MQERSLGREGKARAGLGVVGGMSGREGLLPVLGVREVFTEKVALLRVLRGRGT